MQPWPRKCSQSGSGFVLGMRSLTALGTAATQRVASRTASVRTHRRQPLPPSCSANLPASTCSLARLCCWPRQFACKVLGWFAAFQAFKLAIFSSPSSFWKGKLKNNIKTASMYTEFSNLSCISQNASLKWKPTYKKKKKEIQMLAKESVRKGRARGKWVKTSCLLKSTTVIPFSFLPLSCPVGMWANYHDLYMPAIVLHRIYYTQLFVENSACVGSSWTKRKKKKDENRNFQSLTFPALPGASTSCTSQWKLTFPSTPWISSKRRFDPDVLISTQLKCNQMLDFGG